MYKLLKLLKYLYSTPSDFHGDPRGYAVNVAGHVTVIGLLAALLGFVAGGIAYAVFEGAQWRFKGATPSDCVEDWAFVMTGALAWMTLDWRVAAVASAFFLAGVLWRME